MLDGIDDPKLDSTASRPSSSSQSLPCRVLCYPGHPAPTIMGGLVLWSGSTASVRMLRLLILLSLSVGRQSVSVSATVTAVSEPSVSAVVSVTAITGLQLRHHFRLRPKPDKLVSVGL